MLWVSTQPLEADAPARGVARAAGGGLEAGPWRVIDEVRDAYGRIEVPRWKLVDVAAQLPPEVRPLLAKEEYKEVD